MDDRTKDQVKIIIVHCTASGPETTLADVIKWHKARGFSTIGYHYLILNDGQIKQGRPWQEIGAHCQGQNQYSLGIALVGGNDGKKLNKFSGAQIKSLKVLIEGIRMTFGNIPVYGHRYFNPKKSCPNFDVDILMKTGNMVYLKD